MEGKVEEWQGARSISLSLRFSLSIRKVGFSQRKFPRGGVNISSVQFSLKFNIKLSLSFVCAALPVTRIH
jgi:hypothetical protein